MAIQKTEAIILDRMDYSNTSLIVTFYTYRFGRLSGLAKGARRPKSPFLGTFDLLNHNEIMFYRHTRSSLHTLSHSEVKNGFPGIRESEPRMYAGTYVAEVVKGMTRDDEPHPDAFDLLLNTLRELARAQDTERVVFQFEMKFLGTVGYLPEVEYCISCRSRPKAAQIPFCVSEGGILCPRCASGREAEVQLTSPGALATLRALRRKSLAEGGSVKFTPAVARDIKRLLRPYIVYRMEREPRSMKFL